MSPEGWTLSAVAVLALIGLCPWWTEARARRGVLQAGFGRRGRHRFRMPAPDPRRVWIGGRHAFGRAVGQAPDEAGRGGWVGRLDLFGRLQIDRWLDPPAR